MTISWFLSAVAVMKGHALSLNLRYLHSSAFASSFEFSLWTFSMSLLDVFLMSLFSCIVVRASQSCLPWRCNHVPCPAVSSLSTLGISLNLYPVSKFPALFQQLAVCGARLGLAKKKLSKHRLHFVQQFLLVVWQFSYLAQVFCCPLWTGSCLGEHSGCWFWSGKDLPKVVI